jgi:DNA-binding NarL/FixJ family response regulator
MVFSLNGNNSRIPLSSREYQVLCMIGSGLCVTEIAGRLCLSAKTVSTYRSRLLEKLRLTNTAQLIRYALEQELVAA